MLIYRKTKMAVFEVLNGVFELGWPTFLLATVVLILVFLVFSSRTEAGLPPSIGFRLPVIGHLLQFAESDSRIPLRKLRKKFGRIYSLYLGQQLTIIVTGHDLIIEFLRRDDFVGKPTLPLDKLQKTKIIGIESTGQEWKEHRSFGLSALNDLENVKGVMEPRIHAEVEDFLLAFRNQHETAFDPHEIVVRTTGNIINSVVFGRQFNRQDKRFKSSVTLMNEFKNLGARSIAVLIPCLVKLPGDLFRHKEITKKSQEVIKIFTALIQEHRDGYDESQTDCFASAFIQEMNMHQKSNTQSSLSVESMVAYVKGIHLAQSVTLFAMDWSLALLANNPEMQQRMYTEIAKQVGNRNSPTAQDMSKLPYVEAFYMEVLRFINITVQSLPRAATAETELGGYKIPKNAMLRPDFDSIFADETIWGDPDVFRPDRFLDIHGLFQNNKAFKPFSYGPRDCLGPSFGKMQLFLLISSVVQKFRIIRPEGADLSMKTIDGDFRIGHGTKPYKIIAMPRE